MRLFGALVCFLHFPAHCRNALPMTINDALHRLLLDNLTTATLLLNSQLCLEYMNPAAEMLLAVSGQRSHGQFISDLFTESPEALSSLRQAVEQAQLSKQETTKLLVRGLAHEIKNPLGGIRGAAQLLSRELPNEDLKDYTNVIIEDADRLR